VRTASFLGLAVTLALLVGPSPAAGQEAPKGPPAKPVDVYKQVRGFTLEGRFDLAAGYLKQFLDLNPTDADFLELERLYGGLVFQALRNVPKWSDDPATDKQARANVEALIAKSRGVTEKMLRDPNRINKYVRNLGATYEERVFAEQELKRTGDFAVPFLLDAYRNNPDPQLAAGILGAILKQEPPAVAAWVAGLDALAPEQQFGVLTSVASRPDALTLLTSAQTDYRGVLWRIAAQPRDENPSFHKFATDLLNKIYAGAAQRTAPEVELVNLGRAFYNHKARFDSTKTNPDGSPATVPVWTWDAAASKLVKNEDVPVGTAEEYFGLRHARWALEKKPDSDDAQRLVLALAAERAVERGKFGDVSRVAPDVYKLLSDAPSPLLTDLLDQALNQKRTAQVLAYTQVLGDRADRDAAGPRPGTPPKPSLFVRALNYPDPRVQLAAANAILRSPAAVEAGVRSRVVDVLRRAAAGDPAAAGAKGQALLVDPNRLRADSTTTFLRDIGYSVEQFATGRDLLRRVARSSDFDVILIDRHTPNPELNDLVSHLRADRNALNRPILVVASADKIRPPSLDQLGLRLALLVAATDNDGVVVPPPHVIDVRRPLDEQEALKRKAAQERDVAFATLIRGPLDRVTGRRDNGRVDRMLRIVRTAGVELTPAQEFMLNLRVQQFTYAILDAEFGISQDSSPQTFREITDLNRQLVLQPPTKPELARTGQNEAMRVIERFEIDVNADPNAKKRYDALRARVSGEALGVNVVPTRDAETEFRLARLLRSYPGVAVIPEPYSRVGFEDDLRTAFADPADAPRDPAEKKAGAKLAVGWLQQMATGEVPGFDVKSAEPELRAALLSDDLADAAVAALARFTSAATQEALVALAVTDGRPVPLRARAADAAIRHIQVNGKLTPKALIDPLASMATNPATPPEVRPKLLTLRGLLAYNQATFVSDLKAFNPPVAPTAPPKEPAKEPGKEPDPKDEKKDDKKP
jgi:CheY-like chemotaxis protein